MRTPTEKAALLVFVTALAGLVAYGFGLYVVPMFDHYMALTP